MSTESAALPKVKSEKSGTKNKRKISNTAIIILALFILWIVFNVLTTGSFLSPRNISNLFRQMSITAILATGMMFVIISGEIDLSVGSGMALLGGIASILNVKYGMGMTTVIPITIILGILIGLWNGYWVAYKKVASFIVTLSGMLAFRGILVGITGGKTIAPIGESFKVIGQSYISSSIGFVLALLLIGYISYSRVSDRRNRIEYKLEVVSKKKFIIDIGLIASGILFVTFILNSYNGIPVPVFIMLCLLGIFTYIANKTAYGRTIYAVGGNIEATKLSGVDTKRVKLIIYVFLGILTAVAGLILTSRLGAGSVSAGTNAELDAIASCVIGGASMAGGIGSIPGALLGALVMATLDNGMSMLNVEPSMQYVVKGLILLLAVWMDTASKKKR